MKQEIATQQTQVSASDPSNLLRMAIESDADLEKLEKLMQLQERWEKKEAIKAFKRAMACFQSKKPVLVKDSNVNFQKKDGSRTNYNYLSLAGIQKAIDGVLSECGISYRWEQEDSQNNIKITCVVSHFDGHEERTWLSAPADTSGGKNTIQSIASTVTYLKRYTLEGALGLSSHEDDDGQGHRDPAKPKQLRAPNKAQYAGIMKKVNKGEVSLQQVQENFSLTEEQVSALSALQETKPKES